MEEAGEAGSGGKEDEGGGGEEEFDGDLGGGEGGWWGLRGGDVEGMWVWLRMKSEGMFECNWRGGNSGVGLLWTDKLVWQISFLWIWNSTPGLPHETSNLSTIEELALRKKKLPE